MKDFRDIGSDRHTAARIWLVSPYTFTIAYELFTRGGFVLG